MNNWSLIATIAVGFVTPLVKKASEKAAEKVGEAIFNLIKDKFKDDEEAESALRNFEKNPDRYEMVLADILREKAETDPKFGASLRKLIEAADEQQTTTIKQEAIGKGIAQAAGTDTSATVSMGKEND